MDTLQRRRLQDQHKQAPVRARPVMNVTPLVDVVLVLLIIFMVVIPALQQGLSVEIAGIFNVDPASDSKNPFLLSITKEHALYFEQEPLDAQTLERRLRAASRAQPGRRIVLRADKQADYARVREIYKVAQSSGFPGISLRVNRLHDSEED